LGFNNEKQALKLQMNSIKLSIITPVFNGFKYLENCLENVANQSFRSLEHLIIDGGSNDGSQGLVAEWQKKYPHIRLYSEKDRGQSDAMNKGIRLANGSIIGFLNVDDYYEPNILAKIPKIFENLSEPTFVCGNLNIWNPDGSLKHFSRPSHISLAEIVSDRFEWPYNPSSYFYHKSLHDICGFYNESNHYCMDYEFILEAAQRIKLHHYDELWGNFCQVEGSKTLVRFSNELQDAMMEIKLLRKKVIEQMDNSSKSELSKIIGSNEEILESNSGKNYKNRISKLLKKYFS
jgi:glycosyltransferase involved in cell wall biosynthesis